MKRLIERDGKMVRKKERGNEVNNEEIDRIGEEEKLRGNELKRKKENLRRSNGMNIDEVGKGMFKLRNIGKM